MFANCRQEKDVTDWAKESLQDILADALKDLLAIGAFNSRSLKHSQSPFQALVKQLIEGSGAVRGGANTVGFPRSTCPSALRGCFDGGLGNNLRVTRVLLRGRWREGEAGREGGRDLQTCDKRRRERKPLGTQRLHG